MNVNDKNILFDKGLDNDELQQIQVGKQAFINLISIKPKNELPENVLIEYDFRLQDESNEYDLVTLIPSLVYQEQSLPSFTIKKKISKVLHGSCRKPHFKSSDALCQVDNLLAKDNFSAQNRPSLLMMSGDQVYVDDVSGPMLVAIQHVIKALGLFDESWTNEEKIPPIINNSQQLIESRYCFYQRDEILPHDNVNRGGLSQLFSLKKQPIFTTENAKNHLITFAEVMAMYLLVWSPELWKKVDLSIDNQVNIPPEFHQKYLAEFNIINEFVAGLASVRRAMAHLPCYMIFDDHDVTDDWNLTRGWEEAAYNNAFSKQVLGNALIGYWLCQGWGNAPNKFSSLMADTPKYFSDTGIQHHAGLINELFSFEDWHYTLQTSPKIVVLDTRTRRWRSESNAGKPSGLMDWESLSELQQELINQPDVIVVSPAPIYGVKLIETVQRVFTFFGKPLLVDAENWMAHSGTANVMLNIFRHYKTPPNFIILSGDVHYSFVYEVTHRFRRNRSKIIQITCSGLKNQFPAKLLDNLDKLNRVLYATYSPLNWFTKRRRMKVKVRKPVIDSQVSLYNSSGVGLLTLCDNNQTIEASVIKADTGEQIEFTKE